VDAFDARSEVTLEHILNVLTLSLEICNLPLRQVVPREQSLQILLRCQPPNLQETNLRTGIFPFPRSVALCRGRGQGLSRLSSIREA